MLYFRMFFKASKSVPEKIVQEEYGRVYVLRIELDEGFTVWKIGKASDKSYVDRAMQVLRGFFMAYRYVPRTELRKAVRSRVPYLLETHMHHELKEFQYVFPKAFDGSTEFFRGLDEDVVLDYLSYFDYEQLLPLVSNATQEEAVRQHMAEYDKVLENRLPF